MASRIKDPIKWRPKNGTIGNWFHTFCMVQEPNITRGTCLTYEHAWDFFAPAFERFDEKWLAFKNTKGKAMNHEDRRAAEKQWLDAIRMQTLSRSRERQYSAHTINMRVRIMKTFWNYLRENERIVVTKFLKIEWGKLFRTPPAGERRIIYTPEQVELWQKYRPSSYSQWRAWTIGMFMLDCGARIEECLALRKNDFHMRENMVELTGKGDKQRLVKLTNYVTPHLIRWQTRFVNPELENPFFSGVTKGAKAMSKRNSYRNLMVVLRKCGIIKNAETPPKGRAWHSFRHTSATGKLINGEDIYRLKETLGHSDLKVTETYLHLANAYSQGGKDTVSPLNPTGAFATRS